MAFPATNWFKATWIEKAHAPANGTANSTWDLNGDTWYITLYTDGTFTGVDFDTNVGYSASPWNTTYEISTGGGYTQGANKSLGTTPLSATISPAGTIMIDSSAADPAWTSSTITAYGCLIWTNNPTTNKNGLVAYNFGGVKSSSNGTFTVAFNALGLLTFT